MLLKIFNQSKFLNIPDNFSLSPFSWSGSHVKWGQSFRLRHLTTGLYLGLVQDQGLVLLDPTKSDIKATSFCFRTSKVWREKMCSFT